MDFIRDYLKFLFSLSDDRRINVAANEISGKKHHETTQKQEEKSAKQFSNLHITIALIMTYTMSGLMVLSLIATIIFLFVSPGKDTPSIYKDIIIAGMGYYGGTISSYFKGRK